MSGPELPPVAHPLAQLLQVQGAPPEPQAQVQVPQRVAPRMGFRPAYLFEGSCSDARLQARRSHLATHPIRPEKK
jgi:hypothetical protein